MLDESSTHSSIPSIQQGAATAYALSVNTTFPQIFPPELNTQYATVILSPSTLTIPGNSTAVIRVTFSRPTMLIAARIPVFSGYINIQSSNNESLHLPYAGIGCNMKDVIITDFESRPPYVSNSSDVSAIPVPIGTNETFNVSNYLPTFNCRLVMGSSVMRLDILDGSNQTNIIGSVPDFPRYWVPRTSFAQPEDKYQTTWNGTLSTGVQVPAGRYMILYRVLKIFGDQNNNNDYENWTSPVFGIEYSIPMNISSSASYKRKVSPICFAIFWLQKLIELI